MRQKDDIAKAELICLDVKGWKFEFPFNPEASSFSLSRSVSWNPGGASADGWGGPLEYDDGSPDELSFAILLDQSVLGEIDPADVLGMEKALLSALASFFGPSKNEDSVLPAIQELYRLTLPIQPAEATDDPLDVRPPICAFVWKDFEFMGAVTSMDVEFLLVDSDGTPKRAKVTMKMSGRAFSGGLDLEKFLKAEYKLVKGKDWTRPFGESRDDILKLLS